MKKSSKLILFLFLIIGGLFLLRLATKPAEKRVPMRAPVEKITVKVSAIKKEDLNLILDYVGSLKAKDEINVYSKVSGKLAEYLLGEGENVEKGQTIALVDRDETGLKYELAKVESPISGILGRTLLDKGANILPASGMVGGAPLAVVVNMEEMIVRLNISEADIPYIKKGLRAEIKVDAYPADSFLGQITKVSEVVDTQTRTLPIEISIANSEHKLKSGMFCRIKIVAAQLKDRLVLAQGALIQEQGATYVFVVKDRTARKTKVILGAREDSKIEITQGLEEGEQVIVFGQQGLKDGTNVEVIQE